MGEGRQAVRLRGSERKADAELFGKRSQLIVYHFMFSPEWDEGCPHCSFWADHYDGTVVHLERRDVTFVVISRAPLAKIQPFKKRMGWRFKWISSSQTDFNYDYGVSFTPQDIRNGTAFYNYVKTDPGPPDREDSAHSTGTSAAPSFTPIRPTRAVSTC